MSSDERTEKAFQLGVDNRRGNVHRIAVEILHMQQAAVYVSSALDLNNLNNSSAKIKKEDARRTKYTICSDSESWSIITIGKRESRRIQIARGFWSSWASERTSGRLAAARQKLPKVTPPKLLAILAAVITIIFLS